MTKGKKAQAIKRDEEGKAAFFSPTENVYQKQKLR
jgi:hypothetical protein